MDEIEKREILTFATILAMNGLASNSRVDLTNEEISAKAVDLGQTTITNLDEKLNELGLNK